MSRPVAIATRPQLALQSYLDSLLQEAAVELAENSSLDEFEAAVLEEQTRDAGLFSAAPVQARAEPPVVVPLIEPAPAVVARAVTVEPVIDVHLPATTLNLLPGLQPGERPEWAQEPFECLLFDVAGRTGFSAYCRARPVT